MTLSAQAEHFKIALLSLNRFEAGDILRNAMDDGVDFPGGGIIVLAARERVITCAPGGGVQPGRKSREAGKYPLSGKGGI
jgi:hypothetical protein